MVFNLYQHPKIEWKRSPWSSFKSRSPDLISLAAKYFLLFRIPRHTQKLVKSTFGRGCYILLFLKNEKKEKEMKCKFDNLQPDAFTAQPEQHDCNFFLHFKLVLVLWKCQILFLQSHPKVYLTSCLINLLLLPKILNTLLQKTLIYFKNKSIWKPFSLSLQKK